MMYGCVCDGKYKMPKVILEENGFYKVDKPNNLRSESIFPCSVEVIETLVKKINELQEDLNKATA